MPAPVTIPPDGPPSDVPTWRVERLLEEDPFRRTRTDAELKRIERDERRDTDKPYSSLLVKLLGIDDPPDELEARAVWRSIVQHRKEVAKALGRPVPLRAVALDWLYLREAEPVRMRPLVVSRSTLAHLVDESRIDPSTGLLRKRSFQQAAMRAFSTRPLAGGCVVWIDLDGFKEVNDRLGHATGDAVLRRFAQVVGQVVRRSDLVGRVGGDEFALALVGASPRTARAIATRLRASFEEACAAEGVSFSFGISAVEEGTAFAAALDRADSRMYRQKRRRKVRSGR